MAAKKTYQFALKEEECKLFRDLRLLQKRSTEVLTVPDTLKSQRFDISVHTGSRYLGHIDINAGLGLGVIYDFACVGVDSLRNLLNEYDGQDKVADADEIAHNEDQTSNLSRKTRLIRDNVPEKNTNKSFDSTDALPFIKSTALTVDESNLQNSVCVDTLQRQFPQAIIKISKPNSEERDSDKAIEKERPNSSERTIAGPEDPQKSVQSKLTSNPFGNLMTTALDGSSELSRLDPIEHLRDLANYAADLPASTFSYLRRLEMAHARAIQNGYGKAIDSGGCSYCKEHGLECKVYQTQLVQLSHVDFGHACQNCRLSQATCDLPSANLVLDQEKRMASKAELKSGSENTQAEVLSQNTVTSSTAAPSKPGLLSRMTTENPAKPVGPLDTRNNEDAVFNNSRGSSATHEDQKGSKISLADSPILDVAAKIGLELPDRVSTVILAMYTQWQNHEEVKRHLKRQLTIQDFYSNLVNLYILGYAKVEMDLCYAVLLRFQTTNYQNANNTELPDFGTAVRAFQYLPYSNPLCQWIAILYAFLWGTEAAGDYTVFMEDNPGLDKSALTKLLYSVARIRDPLVMGHDNAVIARWCEVHNHATEDTWEIGLCEEMQSAIKINIENAKEMENARMLEEAQKMIDQFGQSFSGQSTSTNAKPGSSFSKGKRKVNGTPTNSYKKYKRSGGYSSGW